MTINMVFDPKTCSTDDVDSIYNRIVDWNKNLKNKSRFVIRTKSISFDEIRDWVKTVPGDIWVYNNQLDHGIIFEIKSSAMLFKLKYGGVLV